MPGEEASSSGAGSSSGGGVAISYDYSNNTSKHERYSNHNKPPMFNGDPEMFSWWKTKMYSHVIGMDDELWDVLEDGVGNLKLDEEGVALDRKAYTAEQKRLYKKHHLIRGILVAALPQREYLKMSDKSTARLCSHLCVQIMRVTRKSEKLRLPCLFISMNYSE